MVLLRHSPGETEETQNFSAKTAGSLADISLVDGLLDSLLQHYKFKNFTVLNISVTGTAGV
jgi:hypothetical protein